MAALPTVGDLPTVSGSNNTWGTENNNVHSAFIDFLTVAHDTATGDIRVANTDWIKGRNAANDGDVNMLKVNASDLITYGARMTSDGYISDSNTKVANAGAFNVVSAYAARQGGGLIGDTTILFTGNVTDTGAATFAISGATNASPIVITASGHTYTNGQVVAIGSVGGNTAANGKWTVANVSGATFELAGSTGNSNYTTGGNATTAGALYGASIVVSPTVTRVLENASAGTTAFGDDVVGVGIYNAGSVRATCGLVIGGGVTGDDFAQAIGIDAACLIGLGFTGIGGSYSYGINFGGTCTAAALNFPGTYSAYGIDFQSGTFSGGSMIRLKNDTRVTARNALNNADVNVFKFNTLNEFHVESPARFGGLTTMSNTLYFDTGKNIQFDTSGAGTKIGTATTQLFAFWNATPAAQQILATGAGKTVDNVITFLQSIGLCRQS